MTVCSEHQEKTSESTNGVS